VPIRHRARAIAAFRLTIVLGAALLLAACSPGRLDEATLVLADIDAGFAATDLKRTTAPPRRVPIAFSVDGRSREGDLYAPASEAIDAGLVLVPGLSPDGRNDARLVALATTFARSRFAVLVPEIPGLRQMRVGIGDARLIADAARHLLLQHPEKPLAAAAISFAVGPTVVALFEPDLRSRVDLLISVGGYYDLNALVGFLTTGQYRDNPDAPWRQQRVNPAGKWVVALSNAERVSNAADRTALRLMATRRLEDPEAPIDDLVARLGPEGRTVHALLVNDNPEAVPALMAALPAAAAAEAEALDLSRRDLRSLGTRFVLIHGREDPVVPVGESWRFITALAPDQGELYVVDAIGHVDRKPLGLIDRLRLLDAVYEVLSVRDGAAD